MISKVPAGTGSSMILWLFHLFVSQWLEVLHSLCVETKGTFQLGSLKFYLYHKLDFKRQSFNERNWSLIYFGPHTVTCPFDDTLWGVGRKVLKKKKKKSRWPCAISNSWRVCSPLEENNLIFVLTPILFQNDSQTQFGRMHQAKCGRCVLTYHLSKLGLIEPGCSSLASSRPYGDIKRIH